MIKKAVPQETTVGQNILANGGPSVQLANTANERTENPTEHTNIAASKSAVEIVLPADSAVQFVQPADAGGEKMSNNMTQQVQPKPPSSVRPTKGI